MQSFGERLQIEADGQQQIVEVVGDLAGDLADCFHFLGLAELLFEPQPRSLFAPAGGQVAQNDPGTRPALGPACGDRYFGDQDAAVLAAQLDLAPGAVAHRAGGVPQPHSAGGALARGGGRQQHGDVTADRLGGDIAGHRLCRLVEGLDHSTAIGDDDPLGRRVDDRAAACRGGAQPGCAQLDLRLGRAQRGAQIARLPPCGRRDRCRLATAERGDRRREPGQRRGHTAADPDRGKSDSGEHAGGKDHRFAQPGYRCRRVPGGGAGRHRQTKQQDQHDCGYREDRPARGATVTSLDRRSELQGLVHADHCIHHGCGFNPE